MILTFFFLKKNIWAILNIHNDLYFFDSNLSLWIAYALKGSERVVQPQYKRLHLKTVKQSLPTV
jgi:hypothetical protein